MPKDTSDELQPGERFAKYTVERKLGHGGFGAVYLVENDLGMRFALKVLHSAVAVDAENRKRFLREMHIAMGISHENAVPVRDADMWKDRLYYTMDYVQGLPLDEVLRRLPDSRAHPARVIEWCRQLLRFLEFLHRRGFIHRDLKPANMMLEIDGGVERIRVLDLGIAKALTADAGTTLLTSGMIVGTPAYMAPEHLCGDAIDHRIDLYATGIILYECLAGVRPFRAPTVQQLRQAVLDQAPRPVSEFVPGLPSILWKILDRALQKEPNARIPDAATFLRELDAAALVVPKDLALATTLPLEPTPATVARKRQRILAFSLGGVLLAAAATAGWKLWIAGETTDPLENGTESNVVQSEPHTPLAVVAPQQPPAKPEALPEETTSVSSPPSVPLEPEIVAPRDGAILSGVDFRLELRIAGPGPFELQSGGLTQRLESLDDSLYGARLVLHEQDGPQRIEFTVHGPGKQSAARALEVNVDRTAPRILKVEPASGSPIAGADALVTVTADEPLGDLTRIGTDTTTKIDDSRASARIRGQGLTAVPIVLVDVAGNRAQGADYELRFAHPPPTVSVLSPEPGTVLSANSIDVLFQVQGAGDYVARLADLDVPLDTSGRGAATVSLGSEGKHEFQISISERDLPDTEVTETFSVTVDRTAPTALNWVLSPPGFALPGTKLTLTINASEPLYPGTAIAGDERDFELADGEITAKLTSDAKKTSVRITLVDSAGNRGYLDVPLTPALIPAGFKVGPGARPDPISGWVSPIVEPRTGIALVLIPPTPPEGFELGALTGDKDARPDEGPRHRIVLSRPYYLGRSEVTWEQLAAAKQAGAFASPQLVPDEIVVQHWTDRLPGKSLPADFPCVSITWDEASELCRSLGLCLPSEAQWEWACRMPVPTGRYAWGYDFNKGLSWANVSDSTAKFGSPQDPAAAFDDGFYFAAGIDGFQATELGLIHLTGNVLEWCRDYYDSGVYARRAAAGVAIVDPTVAVWRDEGSERRVLRGGAFRFGETESRMTRRFSLEPDGRVDYVGFRVCLEPKTP